ARLAEYDVSAGPRRRRQCREGSGEPAPDEARAEAHRDVVAPRVEVELGRVAFEDLDAVGKPSGGDAFVSVGRELGSALDARDRAAELAREDHRRPTLPARDVEHVRPGAEPQALAEEPDL